MSSDVPLEPMEDAGCFQQNVVDLDSVRIRVGRTSPKTKPCEHKHMIYSASERRVWCENCERTIDGFDAFLILTRHFEAMEREAKHRQSKLDEALSARLVRRASKAIDKQWSGSMIPCCPECGGGLFPEDFVEGSRSTMGRDYALARRKKRVEKPHV